MFLQKRRKKDAYYRGPVTPLEEDLFVEVVEQSNPVQMMFGTLVLWMGWYGLRSGLNKYFCFSNRLFLQNRQIEVFANRVLTGGTVFSLVWKAGCTTAITVKRQWEERIFDQRNVR